MILSIDPGASGAMLLYDELNKAVLRTFKFTKLGKTFDHRGMRKELSLWKEQYNIEIAVIEKVHSMPQQGVASTFSFGLTYGMQISTVASLDIPYTFIKPSQWSREMHQGISPDLKPKEKTQVAIGQLFPEISFKTPRAQKHHGGLADCLLIADFWRRKGKLL